ncbi:MAG: FAD binding domain-containing protein [Oscillospiraceae bacterium]
MKYIIAKSIDEAVEALYVNNSNARVIAGASDLMIDMENGKISAEALVDITKIDELKTIKVENGNLVIGAAATLSEISRSPIVNKYFPSLAKGAGTVGSLQIRNSATLMGNVITAQPAADAAMSVAALAPVFEIVSKQGKREATISEMYVGFGKSAVDCTKELVTFVRIPLPTENEAASFIRLELRKSLSLPMLNASAMAHIENGKVVWARIAMGPVGVGPTFAKQAQDWLVGKELTEENMAHAGELALQDANPRSNPLRGSKEYREQTLPVLVKRALAKIKEQIEA